MADINNFTEITENFDTIKTLLNSIRAQGILNTSDVDKLLSGINSKLEKINTEEDIDLIKIFLSELKQNLDERHSVLLSKFGAIESLFSNLLKNSSETLKSSEVKELFDIVATNLSVFSREVVSQKETLTDIMLRLDAMRSDDSQKKDIIKNITLLKNDIERLTNGFDSIVLSLNENFKTIIKTISGIDPSETINNFGKELEDIVSSSNTILSALQVLDKKSLQIEDVLKTLATQDELSATKQWIGDLATHEQELINSVENLSNKYYKIDNLADKIDASVDIIAGLKALITDSGEQNANLLLEKLKSLESELKLISSNNAFEEFKVSLEKSLRSIYEGSEALQHSVEYASAELIKVKDAIRALDIDAGFKVISTNIAKSEQNLRDFINIESDKVIQLVDVNTTRTLNEITSGAEELATKLNHTHSVITGLCEKSFADVEESISGLKAVVSQIDENNVSANNAIFSNITDRLAIFENSLKVSLEKQEDYVANSSIQLLEQIKNLKDLSGVLDYKIDSSVIELSNSKQEFAGLKSAVENVLALDFVNKVKDLKVDLYAVKQDLVVALESSTGDLSEHLSNDLFGKYELLISKLDTVESELKQAQNASLNNLKSVLDNISATLLDILSYVSSKNELNTDVFENKLESIARVVNDSTLNYVENVRDIVEVIRTQVETNLKSIQEDTSRQVSSINDSIKSADDNIRAEIQYSYKKLLEVQEDFADIKNVLSDNNNSITANLSDVIDTTGKLQEDFEQKLIVLKTSIMEKLAEFQQELTCENADTLSEIKFTAENLHTKSMQNSQANKDEIRGELAKIFGSLKLNVEELTELLASSTLKVEGANKEVISYIKNEFGNKIDKSIEALEAKVAECSENFDSKIGDATTRFDSSVDKLGSRVISVSNDIGVKYEDTVQKLDCSVDLLTQRLSEFSGDVDSSVGKIISQVGVLGESVNELSAKTTAAISSTLAKILENFVSFRNVLSNFNEESNSALNHSVELVISEFEKMSAKINDVDANIDEDLARQFSLMENSFDILNQTITDSFSSSAANFEDHINAGLGNIESRVKNTVIENLTEYKQQVEQLFNKLSLKSEEQTNVINEKVVELNRILSDSLTYQNNNSERILNGALDNLQTMLSDNVEVTASNYEALKCELKLCTEEIEEKNRNLKESLKVQLRDIIDKMESGISEQTSAIFEKFDSVSSSMQEISSLASSLSEDLSADFKSLREQIVTLKEGVSESVDKGAACVLSKLDTLIYEIESHKNDILSVVSSLSSDDGMSLFSKLRSEMSEVREHLINKIEQINTEANTNKFDIISKSESILQDIKVCISSSSAAQADNLELKLKNISAELNQLFSEVAQTQDEIQKERFNLVLSDMKELLENIVSSKDEMQEYIEQVQEVIVEQLKQNVNLNSKNIQDLHDGMSQFSLDSKNFIEEKANEIVQQLRIMSELSEEESSSHSEALERVEQSLRTELNELYEQLKEENKKNLEEKIDTLVQKLQTMSELAETEMSRCNEANEKSIQTEVSGLYLQLSEENNHLLEKTDEIIQHLHNMNENTEERYENIKDIFEKNVQEELTDLYNRTNTLLEEHYLNILSQVDNNSAKFLEEIGFKTSVLETMLDTLNQRLDKDELSRMNIFQAQLEDMRVDFKTSIQAVLKGVEDKLESLVSNDTEVPAQDNHSIEMFVNKLSEQVSDNKETITACRDFIQSFITNELEAVSDSITKESDAIVRDLSEQMSLLRDSQKDEYVKLAAQIEHSVEDYIYTNISELESYLDVKMDTSAWNNKLDSIKSELMASVENILAASGRLLEASVFDDAVSDMKKANEILISSMADTLSQKLEGFISGNVAKVFDERYHLFNKNFIDTLVDKYEELKLFTSEYNKSLDNVESYIDNLLSKFESSREEISASFKSVLGDINTSIDKLHESFMSLQTQILNKSFDEAFQASVKNQIQGLQNLVEEQLGYLQDISGLCSSNLPELHELDNLVKYNLINSMSDVMHKLDAKNMVSQQDLDKLKTDIITQFITVFNQISFVAEQEEILDFIQTKHSDLISILSHIATTVNDVGEVKDNLAVVDSKVDSLREEINLINEKITSIMSSDGDVNYVYSLQDLESDIANLRISLKDIKENNNNSIEIDELIESSRNMCELISSIKGEFTSINEDIASISTRTNRLILASDESYKSLQDNLQDFKLVINDLDERTKNFAQESGIAQLDSKLGAINTLMQTGAKTNQIFNQVFEYLAEWVDNAGAQISAISDKVETLDDIGQIKVMLEDLRAESGDNSETTELAEALGSIFDRQAKKIASLEAKLDRMIVETTINNKNNKINMSPLEDTLNRFLVAIDDKMSLQQDKIDSLESKLEKMASLLLTNDTVQLTKKVGGMDRQIAKLNKSIEKIASHVVEK